MKTRKVRPRPVEPEKPPVAPAAPEAGREAPRTGPQQRKRRQVLPDSLERFILNRKIDSFLKISFLLLLHRHSPGDQINRDYVRQVSLTDALTPDEVISELLDAGLLITSFEVSCLREAPELRSDIDSMAHVLEDPKGREELLRRLYRHAVFPL